MTRLYRYIITASAALALPLAGCINEDAPCPPDEPSDDGMAVTLMFTVVTRSASVSDDAPASAPSRADDCYTDQPGTAAENFINTSDCRFMLFDADRKIIRPIDPEITADETAERTLYTVKATITDQYFDEAVKVAGTGNVEFYIMVVANTHSDGLNGQDLAYYPGATTISEMAGQRKTFDLPPRNRLVPWMPSTDMTANRFIPMAGLQKFSVPASALKATKEEAPLDLSATGNNINMLRSMAKIEVVDKIDMPDHYNPNLKRMKVSKVELVGFNTKGTIMPLAGTGGQWPDFVTAQITGATMPSTDCYTNPTEFNSPDYSDNDILRFFDDVPDNDYPVYSGYVTEYDRKAVNDAGFRRPYIVVTLVDSDGGGVTLYRKFELDKYNADGTPVGTGLEALLRNHIYRYEITGITADDVSLSVNYTVCPWSGYDVTIPTFE